MGAGHLAGKPVRRLGDQDEVEKLLHRIYEHVERQALEVYHSNEAWALKAWAYSNILKDIVVSEEAEGLVTGLMSPLFEWQSSQEFDPLTYYRDRLETEGLAPATKQVYILTANRFVLREGKKRDYSDDDFLDYLKHARKRYPRDESEGVERNSTYHHECRRVLQFLRRLPGADRNRQLPIKVPQMPEEQYRPTFSDEEIERLIWSAVIDDWPGDFVVRVIVTCVYGARLGELAKLSSEDINLNDSTISLRVLKQKRKVRRTQPIPPSLVPLFAVPVRPISRERLAQQLRKACRKAGIIVPHRGGFHSIRRRVVTEVCGIESSDLNVHNYFRWSTPRQFNILSIYKQTPTEETDRAILSRHPFVKILEEVCPYILNNNPTYLQHERHITRIIQAMASMYQPTPYNT